MDQLSLFMYFIFTIAGGGIDPYWWSESIRRLFAFSLFMTYLATGIWKTLNFV